MFNLVGLGGTFDHFHEGHELLIKTALTISKKVIIGLTTNVLLKEKKYLELIEDYDIRKENLKNYIKSITNLERVEIVELNDPYGPPIYDPKFEGLVLSQETYPMGIKMNEIRQSKGYPPLILIVIPIIKDKLNQIISSTNIRKKLLK